MIFVIILGVILLVGFALLSGISFLLIKKLRIYGTILVTGGWSLLMHQIYTAFYPTEDFYREIFAHYWDFELPQSAEFVYKRATYPDFHGDYAAVFIVELEAEDIKELQNDMKMKSGDIDHRMELDHDLEEILGGKIDYEFYTEKGHYSEYRTFGIQRGTSLGVFRLSRS